MAADAERVLVQRLALQVFRAEPTAPHAFANIQITTAIPIKTPIARAAPFDVRSEGVVTWPDAR